MDISTDMIAKGKAFAGEVLDLVKSQGSPAQAVMTMSIAQAVLIAVATGGDRPLAEVTFMMSSKSTMDVLSKMLDNPIFAQDRSAADATHG